MKMYSSGKIAKKIVDVSEVSTCTALRRTITYLYHKHHVVFIVLDGFFKQCLNLFRKLAWVLMSQTANMFALCMNSKGNST